MGRQAPHSIRHQRFRKRSLALSQSCRVFAIGEGEFGEEFFLFCFRLPGNDCLLAHVPPKKLSVFGARDGVQ